MKHKKKRLFWIAVLWLLFTAAAMCSAATINFGLLYGWAEFSLPEALQLAHGDTRCLWLFLCFELMVIVLLWSCTNNRISGGNKNAMQQITPDIVTPAPCGEKQHGAARWMDKKRFGSAFSKHIIGRSKAVRKLVQYGYRDLSFYGRNYLFQSAEIEKLYVDTTDGLFRGRLLIGKYKPTEKYSHYFIATAQGTLVFGTRRQEGCLLPRPDVGTISADFAASDVKIDTPVFPGGGFAIGSEKAGSKEIYYYVGLDIHSLTIGGTRVGKTRFVVIPTISLLALAGESMVIIDVKGELQLSCVPFLQRLGYDVRVLDFVEPEKSDRYNFLRPVLDHLQCGEISKAQDATWDIVSALVGEAKGEKIWNNGECSVIAFAVFCVAWECMDHPEYQNMTNVYYFIAEMCRHTEGTVLPIVKYAESLPDTHPAKGLIRISEVAPQRTRGSFFTSALATLRLFTNDAISYMTSGQTLNIDTVGDRKTAIFLVLPDEKTTYNSIATLFISQQYQQLVKKARANGNRLNVRVNFIEDEKGNFPAIPDYDSAITAGGGRGIRFNLFLQSFSQLYEKYGKEKADTIIHNCEVWNFLQCSSESTVKQFHERMGSYTTKSQSGGSSANYSGYSGSYSSSYNLISRKLLEPDEFAKINRPYQLILSRGDPAMMKALPLEQTIFNRMLGLGDQEFNRKVFMERNARRPSADVGRAGSCLWGIWEHYQEEAKQQQEEGGVLVGETARFFMEQAAASLPLQDDYATCATADEFEETN